MTSPVAKFVVALIGGVSQMAGQAITWGLVSGAAKEWLSLAIAVLGSTGTLIAVYFVPNTPPPPPAKPPVTPA